jgi:hypothetical protein
MNIYSISSDRYPIGSDVYTISNDIYSISNDIYSKSSDIYPISSEISDTKIHSHQNGINEDINLKFYAIRYKVVL